jgi:ribosomal-protein-alanine N-acetyltransferase
MMENGQPILFTERLALRPFALADAPAVQLLAGAREVASTTSNVPHPYIDGMAEQWIAEHETQFTNKTAVNFAIVLRESDTLCGAVSLSVIASHLRAELGYWIGVPFWNQGYCTEAAAAVVAYGFRSLGLHRIHASHYARNPASGRVMQKLGMTHEGCLRQHILKWDVFEDLEMYGLLASKWAASSRRLDK